MGNIFLQLCKKVNSQMIIMENPLAMNEKAGFHEKLNNNDGEISLEIVESSSFKEFCKVFNIYLWKICQIVIN